MVTKCVYHAKHQERARVAEATIVRLSMLETQRGKLDVFVNGFG